MRGGTLCAKPRTQACLAISGDGCSWYLIGASPEIRAQIESFPALHPRPPRQTPLAGLLLLNGDLDHTLGLLSLREWSRLDIYATSAVREAFTKDNVLNRAIQRYENHSVWHQVQPGVAFELKGGLRVDPVAIPGKPPIYVSGADQDHQDWNLGLRITHGKRVLGYFPGVAAINDILLSALDGLDALFFDGTLWSDDEMICLGLAQMRGRDMAHLPVSETLKTLHNLDIAKRWFIHVNNTNPILDETSMQAGLIRDAGWRVAEDSEEFEL